MKIIIPDYDLIEFLVNRVEFWTKDKEIIELYRRMYLNLLEAGCFEEEIDLYDLVDNDYVNYCKVIFENDDDYEIIKLSYLNNDFDISEVTSYNCIESASDDLKMFLVRK